MKVWYVIMYQRNYGGCIMKSVLKRFVAGLMIGIGGIVPGVSGGILAVSMGLYKPMLDAVSNILKQFKKSVAFLLPVAIGGVIGICGLSFVVEWGLSTYNFITMCLFFGLVAGGIPSFIKEANSHGGFKPRYLIAAFLGALLIGGLAFLEGMLADKGGSGLPFNAFTAMLCGAVLIIGVVIPGVSTSFILMFLGLYEPLLGTLTTLLTQLAYLVSGGPFSGAELWFAASHLLLAGVGAVIVALPLILFVKKMIEKYHGPSHYAILGFLVVSMLIVFPFEGIAAIDWLTGVIALAFMAAGFLCAMFIDRFISEKGEG